MFPHNVSKLPMGPVEHWNAIVVDEPQTRAELMSKFGDKHLRHAYDAVERRIHVLEHLLQNVVITRQRVFQFHLPKQQQRRDIPYTGNEQVHTIHYVTTRH